MKLNSKRQILEGSETLIGDGVFNVGIYDGASTQKLLIDALTNLYSNPCKAVVRELLSNAIDAVSSSENPEINVYLDDEKLVVSDNGCGMSEEELKDNYISYGNSSKTYDMTQIGAFGFGAKAPLSISDRYTVETSNGEESSFATVAITRKGIQGKIVSSSKPGRGTEVTVYYRDKDRRSYIDTYIRYFIKVCGLDFIHYGDSKPFELVGKKGDISVYVSGDVDDDRVCELILSGKMKISHWLRVNGVAYSKESRFGDFVIMKDYHPGEIRFSPAREDVPDDCKYVSEIDDEISWVKEVVNEHLCERKKNLPENLLKALEAELAKREINRDPSTLVLKELKHRKKVHLIGREACLYSDEEFFDGEYRYVVVNSDVKIKADVLNLDLSKLGLDQTEKWHIFIRKMTENEINCLENSRFHDVTVISEKEYRSCIKNKRKRTLKPIRFFSYCSFGRRVEHDDMYDRERDEFMLSACGFEDAAEKYVVMYDSNEYRDACWSSYDIEDYLNTVVRPGGFSVVFTTHKTVLNRLLKKGYVQIKNTYEIKSEKILQSLVGEYESITSLTDDQKEKFECVSFILSNDGISEYVSAGEGIIDQILSLPGDSKRYITKNFRPWSHGIVSADKILEKNSKKSVLKSWLKVEKHWSSEHLEKYFPGVEMFDTSLVKVIPLNAIFTENIDSVDRISYMRLYENSRDMEVLGIEEEYEEFVRIYDEARDRKLKEVIEKVCE